MAKLKIGAKIKKQMSKRGWTAEIIELVYLNPDKTEQTRDRRYNIDGSRKDDPATVYYRSDGSYIVCNDMTSDVVQVSDINDPNWIEKQY
ncbi:colicin E5-related ribonuclease [Anabaena sp. WFMT]|uniref:colicin E5-related ribonuclease n=1 Tax=Anabaena sp. WFMT TaxID=3449730 RepID=UPI003F2600D3